MASITRKQAIAALHSGLANLAKEVRQRSVSDDDAGYGPDLDSALRRMSVDDVSELTTGKQIAAFLIIARFYALCRFGLLISTRVDPEALAIEGDRDTIFKNVMELREYTAREALAYGFVLEATRDGQTGSANQDVDQDNSTGSWKRDVFPTEYVDGYPPYDPGYYVII